MHTKASKGKEIRIPGPDHPITISPAEGMVLNVPICAHENAWEIVETIDLWFIDSESAG